jgi:nucleoside-diphosphate-sugar epimerase
MPLSGGQLRMASKYLFCDTTKARQELDFSPEHTFHQAAEETYRWYQEHDYI